MLHRQNCEKDPLGPSAPANIHFKEVQSEPQKQQKRWNLLTQNLQALDYLKLLDFDMD